MFEIKPKTRKEIYMAYLAGDLSLELPEPLTRDEVNLYNLCKNRAYGETTTVKEVLEECRAENLEYMDGVGYFVPKNIGLVVGGKYIVTYNGVDYECVGIDGAVANSAGNVFLGDVAYFTPDGHDVSSEPFAVIAMPEDGVTGIVQTAAQVAFDTISIRQEVTEVQKISGKYVEGMGYIETKEIILIEEQDLTFAESNGLNSSVAKITSISSIDVGTELKLMIDGEEYRCTTTVFSPGGNSVVPVAGNLYLAGAGEDTGEPFVIAFNQNEGLACQIMLTASGETHTVKLVGIIRTVYPIDPEFVTVRYDVNVKYGDRTIDKSFDDIVSAHEAGLRVEMNIVDIGIVGMSLIWILNSSVAHRLVFQGFYYDHGFPNIYKLARLVVDKDEDGNTTFGELNLINITTTGV